MEAAKPSFMKKLILAISLLTAAGAHADNDYREAYDDLREQLEVIAQTGGGSCPRQYRGDFRDIAIFFGYGNFENKTFDEHQAKAFARILKKPCAPGIAACGFTEVGRGVYTVFLAKNGVNVRISWTSINRNMPMHLDPNGQYWDQEKRSSQVRADFYRELSKADAVFFLGHSRGGGGLGFNVANAFTNALNYVFRVPVIPMKQALAQRPSRLKMLGLFGCDSDRYYRAEVESVVPRVSLLVGDGDLDFNDGPQAMLGALDSLLARKCEAPFQATLRGSRAEKASMRLIRR